MAIYGELKYHPDETKKHKITSDELQFLKDLQKEMNTQDHVCQAAPRYWGIAQRERIYGIESEYSADGYEITDIDACETVADNFKDFVEYIISSNTLEEIESQYGIKYELELDDRNGGVTIKNISKSSESYVTDIDELIDWIKEYKNYNIVNYRNVHTIVPNAMFLTQKAANEHLKRNGHNYHEDAHPYAMTAYRSTEIDKLYDILESVNWDDISIK